MTNDSRPTVYQHLRLLFPAAWRRQHEQEFVETLRDVNQDGRTAAISQFLDILHLCLVLRWRQVWDGFTDTITHLAGRILTPAVSIIALAILLMASTMRWAGQIQLEFVLASIVVVLIPGIGVLYTVSTAIAGGKQRGLLAALGCTLGIIPHLIVAFLGLSGLMQLGSYVFEIVRWLGVFYLAWIGVGMIRQNGASEVQDNDISQSNRQSATGAYRLVARAVLVNLLNPKLTLFFFAFLPQFLNTASPSLDSATVNSQLVGLASLFMLLTLGGFVLYALAGSAVRSWIRRKPTVGYWVQRSLGVVMLGLAARLAATER